METTEQKQKILSKTLELMKQKEHLPLDLVHLLGQAAGLQLEAGKGLSIELPDLDLSEQSRQVAVGGSFLTPETLPVDKKQFFIFFFRLIEFVKDQPGTMPDTLIRAAAAIEAGLETDELDLETAIDECIKGEGPITVSWAERIPEAPAALRFLILASLAPSFDAGVKALTELLHEKESDEEVRKTGTCPVCGSLPYILTLKETEGFRFASCSICRHEYRIRRLACPVCDTTDSEKMKYFTVKEEPGFRVETCDSCKTYIKTIDFRSLDREAFPALNDLESLALDYLAAEQGYSRPAPSVWGI